VKSVGSSTFVFPLSPMSAPQFFKISLKRSTIGLAPDYRAAARTLGLHRSHQTVYRPADSTTAGLILKLKELVKVENVASIPTSAEINAARRAPRGYQVVEKQGAFTKV
jgi:large subunit ribosomal protein L30